MKKNNIIIFLFALAVVFTSCKKDDKEPVLDTTQTVSPTWTQQPAEDTHFILVEDNAASVVTTLIWSDVQYNLTNIPAPLYTLQLYMASNDTLGPWGDAIEMLTISETTKELTVAELNTAIITEIGVEFPTDTVIDAAFRIKANVNANSVSSSIDSYSEFATFSVTPYSTELSASTLWVPGDYQGWSPGTAPNVYSEEGDGYYEGYVYYPEGGTYEFKFTSAPDWDHTNFGAGTTEGTLDKDSGAGNLSLDDFGNYWLTCDTINLTWTNELRTFALIGSFNDWAGDAELTWDNDNRMFTITMDFDAGTEFKWRANADWDINFGDSGVGDNTLSQGGDNIVLDSGGNYTINLYLEAQIPYYEVIQN